MEGRLRYTDSDACSGNPGPDGEVNFHPFFLSLCADIAQLPREERRPDPPIDTFTGLPGDQVGTSWRIDSSDRFRMSDGSCW